MMEYILDEMEADEKGESLDFYGTDFGLIIEKVMAEDFKVEKRSLTTRIARAWGKLVKGWWECLAELGHDRGC